MKLSILIVSYNVRDLLERCLFSLGGIPDEWEIVVVDNDSRDGTRERVTSHESRVTNFKAVLLDKNLGFARGNTEAYKYATGEYILLLNPDTKVLPNAIEKMVEYLDANPDVWVVGPKLLNEDGGVQKSVRGFPTLGSQILVLLKLHNYFSRDYTPRPDATSGHPSQEGNSKNPLQKRGGREADGVGFFLRCLISLKQYLLPHFDYSKTQEVNQVMGAVLMTRRNVIEKIGFLDPRFKRWFEEVDFCYRVKQAGGKIVYLSEPRIVHSKGESFGKSFSLGKMIKKQYYFNQGMARFFWKNKSVWQSILLFPFLVVSLIGTMLLWILLRLKFPFVKNYNF